MSQFQKFRTTILALASVLWIASPHSLFATEEQFAAYNCAIDVPEGWTTVPNLPPQPGLFAAYRQPDQKAVLYLLVDTQHKPTGPLDDAFVGGFERGIERTGVPPRTSGRFLQLAGVRAYERLGTANIKGKSAFLLQDVIPGGDRFYFINVMRFDELGAADPEVRHSLESFRFLKPPPPLRLTPNLVFYQFGRLFGATAMITAVALVAIFVVIAIVVLLRRKPKRVATVPPPLPRRGE